MSQHLTGHRLRVELLAHRVDPMPDDEVLMREDLIEPERDHVHLLRAFSSTVATYMTPLKLRVTLLRADPTNELGDAYVAIRFRRGV